MRTTGLGIVLSAYIGLASSAAAAPQLPDFTYQGRLQHNGQPANGDYNLSFTLFDAPTGGNVIGAPQVETDFPVTDGLFTTSLSYPGAFVGEQLWLEVAVNGQPLLPRQAITTTPVAQYALSGNPGPAGPAGPAGPQGPAGPPGSYVAGTGITISGGTIAAALGTTAGTVAAGNDPRFSVNGSFIANQGVTAQSGAALWIDGTASAGRIRAAKGSAPDPLAPLPLLQAQVGTAPVEVMRLDDAGSLLLRGALAAGTVPVQGAGVRLLFYPGKGAFRAGAVNDTQWDEASIGPYSWAGGTNATASGHGALAFGDGVVATSTSGTVFGNANTVSGTAGFSAGANNTCSGFACVVLGFTNVATGQGSVALGFRVTANADYAMALGQRVSTGGHAGSFIWGDQSTTTVHNNSAPNQFMVRAAGGVRLRTRSDLGTGCDLPAGSGVFACTSDRTLKEDFRPLDAEEVLLKITGLAVDNWRYIGEPGDVRHVGPTAQDFRAAFGLGTDDRTIGMIDIDGINMLAIQALAARTDALAARQAELDELRSEVRMLRQVVERLAQRERPAR